MATKARKKKSSTIPTLRDLEKRVGRLRKDIERTAGRVTREATRYIPKSRRRQINELVDRVGDLGGTVTKRLTKTVETVRADVEDSVGDLRGTVDKRVKALRKDATDSSAKALETLEKEARKQVERVFRAIGLGVRSDVDGIKKRIANVERRLDDLVEALSSRKRPKADESEAA
jgi:hypothetical protein